MAKRKRIWLRRVVQIFFFLLIALITLNSVLIARGITLPFLADASTHALCPFGGLVSLFQLATTGTLIRKIHESSVVLLVLISLLSVAFGPVFCGWICPLGTFQEWLSSLGRKIFKRNYNSFVPARLDNYLRYLRYVVLIWAVYMIAISGDIVVFENVDPFFALFNFWSSEVAIGGLIVLGVTILASLFVDRPWCKYACPLGAVLGLTNFFNIFIIKRSASTCISCKACDTACPMNIKVSETETVRDPQCIFCLKCTSEEICPVKNTSYVATGWSAPKAINQSSAQNGGVHNDEAKF